MPVSKNRKVDHEKRFQKVDTKLPETMGRHLTYFRMSISCAGEGELEGIIESKSAEISEIIVHAGNRANLIRKAHRVLREKHGIQNPVIIIPNPKERIEGVVL